MSCHCMTYLTHLGTSGTLNNSSDALSYLFDEMVSDHGPAEMVNHSEVVYIGWGQGLEIDVVTKLGRCVGTRPSSARKFSKAENSKFLDTNKV